MNRPPLIRIGTRGSPLAFAQAEAVTRALRARAGIETSIVPISTSGDQAPSRHEPDDKSRFVKEIEDALLRGDVDLAVHSAKDVPATLPDGLVLVGAPAAEDPRDALAGVRSLDALPGGACVGTASLRRRSQLLAVRPDIEVAELRGNVDTRLTRLREGRFDAIVLALAGLRRLHREAEAGATLAVDDFVPAPGQGVLALEARADDETAVAAAATIRDSDAGTRLAAERALVAALGTSCRTPVGAHAQVGAGSIRLQAYAGLPDGSEWVRDCVVGDAAEPQELGERLASRMLAAGAGDILARAEEPLTKCR